MGNGRFTCVTGDAQTDFSPALMQEQKKKGGRKKTSYILYTHLTEGPTCVSSIGAAFRG